MSTRATRSHTVHKCTRLRAERNYKKRNGRQIAQDQRKESQNGCENITHLLGKYLLDN